MSSCLRKLKVGTRLSTFFHLECHNWLLNQNAQLGGFDVNGETMYVEVDETY